MPLHTVGFPSAVSERTGRSRWGLTRMDVASLVIAFLYFTLPGVDHRACMQWIITHVFAGSVACCSVFGVFVVHRSLEVLGIAFFSLLYYLHDAPWTPKVVRQRLHMAKLHPQDPWPWASPDASVRELRADLHRRSVLYVTAFAVIVSLLQLVVFALVSQWDWSRGSGFSGLNWQWAWGDPLLTKADPARMPDKSTIIFQCAVSWMCSETLSYWGHRALHDTFLYKYHKLHHEFKQVSVLGAFFTDIVDAFFTFALPALPALVLFDMHVWTLCVNSIPAMLAFTRQHGGYNLALLVPGLGFDPTSVLPLSTDCERTHDLHHRLSNCNYGASFYVWDRLMGTWVDPEAEEEKQFSRKQVVPIGNEGETNNNTQNKKQL